LFLILREVARRKKIRRQFQKSVSDFNVSVNVSINNYSHLAMAVIIESKVRPARLERATFCFVGKRSIRLSYGRMINNLKNFGKGF
jgi:hypothetical protein